MKGVSRCVLVLLVLAPLHGVCQDPDNGEPPPGGRREALESALEKARREGNAAETREILEALEDLERREAEESSGREPVRVTPQPPFVLDCGAAPGDDGGGEIEERRGEGGGVRRIADQRLAAKAGYGHERGEPYRIWLSAVWGRPERDLFASARIDPGSYRFRLPAGEYLVLLGFCETLEHAPRRRVFDVSVQGRKVLERFDPFAEAGFSQAFRVPARATVRGDEGLAIAFRRLRGEPPIVQAIWVLPFRPRARPPQAPRGLRGAGSYGMNVLLRDPPERADVAGILVQRRREGEKSFRPLTAEPVRALRWIDAGVRPGVRYEYRVQAVDVEGRRSAPAETLSLEPRDPDASKLPWYSLEIPEESLTYILADVHEDRTVQGAFVFQGSACSVKVRLRGASTRFAVKKSYRLEFPRKCPFPSREVTYLKAEPYDFTLQQEKLSCDVFREMGVPVSQARFVNLAINERYQGVYLDIEPVRSPFKKRAGLDPEGTLLRNGSFGHLRDGAVDLADARLRGHRGSVGELAELVRGINRVNRGEFEAFVRAATAWPEIRDYFAATCIAHRTEIEADDSFSYRDPDSGRWLLIPWDNNNGNFAIGATATAIGRPSGSPYFPMTFPLCPHPFWYVLPSRLFHDDALRGEYLARLEEAARGILLSGRIDAMVDANFRKLRNEVVVDPFHWPPESREPFLRSAEELKRFAREHGKLLVDAIARERKRAPASLVINELQLASPPRWVELHNRGRNPVSLRGCFLAPLEGECRPRTDLSREAPIAPGALRVVEIGEIARDRSGGSIGLFRQARRTEGDARAEGDDDRREGEPGRRRVLDWYFFGRQTRGFSYGRCGNGLAFLKPTPGRENPSAGLEPPSVWTDGGVVWQGGARYRVTVRAIVAAPPERAEALALYYRWGTASDATAGARDPDDAGGAVAWKEAPMTLERGPPLRATAVVSGPAAAGTLRYYVLARSGAGLERTAPLTAPRETYSAPARRVE